MPRRNRPRTAAARPTNTRQSRRWIFIGAIAIVAVAVAGILIATSANAPKFGGVPSPDRLTMGSADAAVVIEEYSDFQCPYCALFFREQEPQIIEKYIQTGKARFTYVPYSFLGPESITAAEAAYCAADQNKFWNFHYVLFTNQGSENSGVYSDTNLNRYAAEAGLNMPQFRSCYSAGTYKQQVEDDFVKGKGLGVTGTPSFFVNGKGPFNSVEVLTEIEKALQGQ